MPYYQHKNKISRFAAALAVCAVCLLAPMACHAEVQIVYDGDIPKIQWLDWQLLTKKTVYQFSQGEDITSGTEGKYRLMLAYADTSVNGFYLPLESTTEKKSSFWLLNTDERWKNEGWYTQTVGHYFISSQDFLSNSYYQPDWQTWTEVANNISFDGGNLPLTMSGSSDQISLQIQIGKLGHARSTSESSTDVATDEANHWYDLYEVALYTDPANDTNQTEELVGGAGKNCLRPNWDFLDTTTDGSGYTYSMVDQYDKQQSSDWYRFLMDSSYGYDANHPYSTLYYTGFSIGTPITIGYRDIKFHNTPTFYGTKALAASADNYVWGDRMGYLTSTVDNRVLQTTEQSDCEDKESEGKLSSYLAQDHPKTKEQLNLYPYVAKATNYNVACDFSGSGESRTFNLDKTVKSGETYVIDGIVFIAPGHTLTVEPGGTMIIKGTLNNLGSIVNYGSIVVSSTGYITTSYATQTASGTLTGGDILCEGNVSCNLKDGGTAVSEGNLLVEKGGVISQYPDVGTIVIKNGATMVNSGWVLCNNFSLVGGTLINQGSEPEYSVEYGVLLVGYYVSDIASNLNHPELLSWYTITSLRTGQHEYHTNGFSQTTGTNKHVFLMCDSMTEKRFASSYQNPSTWGKVVSNYLEVQDDVYWDGYDISTSVFNLPELRPDSTASANGLLSVSASEYDLQTASEDTSFAEAYAADTDYQTYLTLNDLTEEDLSYEDYQTMLAQYQSTT